MDLSRFSPIDLLRLNADAVVELRGRGVVRTLNAPLGDYAEWLFCQAFHWEVADNSTKDVDARDDEGTRYQIKGRRLVQPNTSRQLGAIRRLDERNFDVLAAVLFDADFSVMRAALIPHSLVLASAKRVENTNSWRFMLRNGVWECEGVRDVTNALVTAQSLDWPRSSVATDAT